MAGLEAALEKIQQLHDHGLTAQHMVNSYKRNSIAPLQPCSSPFWTVLNREHPTRLHWEGPVTDDVIRTSNFLVMWKQEALIRPRGIRPLILLSMEERNAILASMAHCNEWGHVAAPAAPIVAPQWS
jgi:hypothetical protein